MVRFLGQTIEMRRPDKGCRLGRQRNDGPTFEQTPDGGFHGTVQDTQTDGQAMRGGAFETGLIDPPTEQIRPRAPPG